MPLSIGLMVMWRINLVYRQKFLNVQGWINTKDELEMFYKIEGNPIEYISFAPGLRGISQTCWINGTACCSTVLPIYHQQMSKVERRTFRVIYEWSKD